MHLSHKQIDGLKHNYQNRRSTCYDSDNHEFSVGDIVRLSWLPDDEFLVTFSGTHLRLLRYNCPEEGNMCIMCNMFWETGRKGVYSHVVFVRRVPLDDFLEKTDISYGAGTISTWIDVAEERWKKDV